ncbi:Pentatricopeptide repeat-containing protein [Camellia lanceoleosa]|uniref:Pentatricopeptide repeat-containing protein n=1 Tax=Camellia lanceoleosa TaxID=1840588 RepID=A0ACC0FSS1_9ERIC|nr:Pentatricopeptide repeat-containing protein [Camellia lanceoleosa]
MPHPPSLSLLCPLQEKLQTLFLAPPNPPPPPPPPTITTITTHRGLCSRVSNGDSDSKTTDVENCESVQCENVNSMADWKEVDRVCKVVDELFALDPNMEAILDECGSFLTMIGCPSGGTVPPR